MKVIKLVVVLMVLSGAVNAQILAPVKWSSAAKKVSANEAVLYLKAVIEDGWHIYSVNQKPGGPTKTTITFKPSPDFDLIGKVTEPKPISKFEETFGVRVDYFKGEVVFQQKIKMKAKQPAVKGKVEFMVCTDQECLPVDEVNFLIPIK